MRLWLLAALLVAALVAALVVGVGRKPAPPAAPSVAPAETADQAPAAAPQRPPVAPPRAVATAGPAQPEVRESSVRVRDREDWIRARVAASLVHPAEGGEVLVVSLECDDRECRGELQSPTRDSLAVSLERLAEPGSGLHELGEHFVLDAPVEDGALWRATFQLQGWRTE